MYTYQLPTVNVVIYCKQVLIKKNSIISARNMYTKSLSMSVHSNLIHNSLELEAIQMLVKKEMKKRGMSIE